MKRCVVYAGLSVWLAASVASAHHAFAAEFDVNRPVKVKGTVTKIEWVNPHAWIYVDVKDAGGKVTNWHFELGPPNALFRLGWKKDAVAAGTEVEISGFRAKAQDAVANGRSIILADGRELFSGGSGPGSEGPDKKSDAPKQ
jgi:nucleoid-associated protein YgaU